MYIYDDSHGGRFRYKDACVFAVKPVKGREVEEFSCSLSFQQEGHDTEHAIYLNPGFSLVEVILNVANTICLPKANEIVYSFLWKKKEERETNKKGQKTKSNRI